MRRKKLVFRLGALLLMILMAACGQKSANLQEGAVPPDSTLFENGMKMLRKNQYIKARLLFQTLINTYPDSEFTPISVLSIADSFYEEGGTENLLQAEAQYKDFIIFYPTHEMADDAQMKIVAVNIRLMRAPDRDPTNARKAESELEKLMNDYPDSDLIPAAREYQREVQENLAQGIQMKGDFYFDRGSYSASESRYKEVVDTYPDFSHLDVTLFRLGRSLEENGQIEEAVRFYERVAVEFPFSPFFDDARQRLTLLERNVPPVDESLAARRQANRRTDGGFSVFDPIRNVWRTFAGRPDPYEEARRRAEERRAQQGNSSRPKDQ